MNICCSTHRPAATAAVRLLPQDTMVATPEDVLLPAEQLGEKLQGSRLRTRDSFALAQADALEARLRATPAASPGHLPAGLTRREAEVLRLLATGLANAEIARRLSLSPRTINAHLTTIYGKLGVTTRGAAIRFALDHVPDAGLGRIFLEEWQDDRAEGTTARIRHLLEGMKEDLSYGQPEAAE